MELAPGVFGVLLPPPKEANAPEPKPKALALDVFTAVGDGSAVFGEEMLLKGFLVE